MKRLSVQLTLAFALVVMVMVSTIGLLADLTAGHAFRRYLSYSDNSLHQALSGALIGYYQEQGSWQGIGAAMDQVLPMTRPMRGPMMQPGMPGTVNSREAPLQVVLADENDHVIYENFKEKQDRRLTRDERAAAHDLELDGRVIGKLVIAIPMQTEALGPLEQAFVTRQRWFLAIGAILAGALGVFLGIAMSRNLTAPLQRLAVAARGVANRDFSHRVEVEGSAEVAEVAHAFNEMASALEQAEKQRKNMVADIAHELRAPLSVVQGNLQAILDDVYPLDKVEISRLYDETRLLSRLVGDLRELALADAGQLGLHLRATDLTKILESTADNLTLAAEAQQIDLQIHAQEHLPLVHADPDRVAQVLRNLMINALQHTTTGGNITVSAARHDEGVEIAVRDTGEGIAQEDLPHVFDRFWRADRARIRGDKTERGSGLGLSVALSLVKAHGGRIWVESVPGQGSTFHFTLPLAS